jgi:hypothetical protein
VPQRPLGAPHHRHRIAGSSATISSSVLELRPSPSSPERVISTRHPAGAGACFPEKREIRRRPRVVAVFTDDQSALDLCRVAGTTWSTRR